MSTNSGDHNKQIDKSPPHTKTAGISSCSAVRSPSKLQANGDDASVVRIVVIGAGLSGLTCARRLTQQLGKQAHRITVLEARDRVGGRTHSIAELNLDLGASWVFSHDLAVRALARELNIDTVEQYESGTSLVNMTGGGVQTMNMGHIHGGVQRLRGGTGSLCKAILEALSTLHGSTTTVRLNSPVTNVSCQNDGTIRVMLRDYQCIVGDYVVLALPPKLFTLTILLTPPLPTSVTAELSECVTWMASTCKAVMVYEQAWWRAKNLSGFAISRRSTAQEWHDASSDTCNALFVFCLAGTSKQQVIDATVMMFGDEAAHPSAVYMTDWSTEAFTSSSGIDGRGGHPHTSNACRRPFWNGRLWLSSSEVSDTDGGFLEGAVRRAMQVADQLTVLIRTQTTSA